MRRITALLASLALVLTLVPAAAMAAPSATGTWIVQLRADVNSATEAGPLARAQGGSVGHVYRHAMNGFSFRGSAAGASALARNPKVTIVEADAEVWLDTTQTGATWGLDRIDQRARPLDGNYTYDTTGDGVTAYVIDSGIRFSHSQFGGRAVLGRDLVGDGQNGNDCNGHGTHVAGTIGGSVHGVAKEVTLVSVRVFGCTGGSSWSTIIAGINWAIEHHEDNPGPAVANMSLGGGASSSVDTATNSLINSGVATAVAAGNGDFLGRQANACNYSPARVAAAMTISATNSSDAKVSWANYGNCVDWFAPGVSITSAWHTSNTATNTISGTSMATPHTAGVAALYLEANPTGSPSTVRDAIYEGTTKGIVTSSSTANNHLLFSLLTGGGTEPPPDENIPPVAGDDAATTDEGVPTTIDVLANDSDADSGDTLTVASATQADNGTTVVNADDTITYTPDTDFFGTDSFTYLVTDGTDSGTGTVTITVNEVPTEPPPGDGSFSVDLAGSSTSQGSTWTAIVTVTATDSSANPVAGVEVSGLWNDGSDGGCSTTSSGTCAFGKPGVRKRVGSVTFEVTNAVHVFPAEPLTYDGGPDLVTVLKP